jgi:hypothetical protein
MTIRKMATANTIFTPRVLIPHTKTYHATHFEHYASLMVYPVMGETISSSKRLMNDPVTAQIWQTAFGKDFGDIMQGCNKTGQKGTNAMFVMTLNEIAHALQAGKNFTYANPVVNYRPQKEDPNRIWIMAGGNLISCNSELSVHTANINTAKLHWYSVVSMDKARYMCLDIIIFTSLPPLNTLNTCASPRIISPVGLSSNIIFPNKRTKDMYTSRCAESFGDSHRQASWQTNAPGKNLRPLAIWNVFTQLACGTMSCIIFCSHLLWTILA